MFRFRGMSTQPLFPHLFSTISASIPVGPCHLGKNVGAKTVLMGRTIRGTERPLFAIIRDRSLGVSTQRRFIDVGFNGSFELRMMVHAMSGLPDRRPGWIDNITRHWTQEDEPGDVHPESVDLLPILQRMSTRIRSDADLDDLLPELAADAGEAL